MPKNARGSPDELAELIRTLLIVQLRLAGLGNREIRSIVSVDIKRVLSITKHMRTKKAKGEA